MNSKILRCAQYDKQYTVAFDPVRHPQNQCTKKRTPYGILFFIYMVETDGIEPLTS